MGPSARVSRRRRAAGGCGRSGAQVISSGGAWVAADATRCASARGTGGCSTPPWASLVSPAASALVCAPCPARSSSGLGDLDPAQPPLGHRQRTPGEQTAPHPQGAVRLAGEPVAVPALGEQQQRPDHRGGEHGDGDQPDGGGQARSGQAFDRVAREPAGVGARLVEDVEQRARHDADPGQRGERERGEAQPRPVEAGQLDGGRRARPGWCEPRPGSGRAAHGAGGRPRPCSRRRARGPRARRCRRWPTRSSPRTARRSGAPAGP